MRVDRVVDAANGRVDGVDDHRRLSDNRVNLDAVVIRVDDAGTGIGDPSALVARIRIDPLQATVDFAIIGHLQMVGGAARSYAAKIEPFDQAVVGKDLEISVK